MNSLVSKMSEEQLKAKIPDNKEIKVSHKFKGKDSKGKTIDANHEKYARLLAMAARLGEGEDDDEEATGAGARAADRPDSPHRS